MTAQRSGNLPTLHFYEEELFHKVRSDRRLAAGLLIFSIAFCALAFHVGFKEMRPSGKCDLMAERAVRPLRQVLALAHRMSSPFVGT